MSEKILVGMSGGVDSSVAAALLIDAGYQTSGVTLSLYNGENVSPDQKYCGSLADIIDAKKVCDRLGIEHYALDFTNAFKEKVIKNFIDEYLVGRTPNPCIQCNKHIKFGEMFKKSEELGFDKIATGHYAQIKKQGGRFVICKPKDISKDQTYVLYSLPQEVLSKTLFPLGELTKDEVRQIALEKNFVNANKPDSQDICFVPDKDYAAFISRSRNCEFPKGDFVDLGGNVIGSHLGMIRYTIGQRKGLGMGFGKPVYVISKDPKENKVVLGDEEHLFTKTVKVTNLNLVAIDKLTSPLVVRGKLRYRQTEESCRIIPLDNNTILAEFDSPQRAATPGQAAVFYDGDTVVCGGVIE